MKSKVVIVKINDEPNIFKGTFHFDSGLNAACEKAMEIVKDDPTKSVWYDIESGWPTIIDKDEMDRRIKFMDSLKPKSDNFDTGKIFFFGTSGNVKCDDWKNLFSNTCD